MLACMRFRANTSFARRYKSKARRAAKTARLAAGRLDRNNAATATKNRRPRDWLAGQPSAGL
eukprot:8441679-Lingulodinium_polyedra.AAC.1